MILQALTQYYETLVQAGVLAGPGWGPVKASYALSIAAEGTLEQVIAKYIFKQAFVVTSMLSLIKIIRAHNRPCSTFLNSRFKSRQVYLIKSTIT